MSSFLPKSIRELIDEFSRLPGIGPKSAQRLAMHLLHSPEGRVKGLGDAVLGLKKGIEFCSVCWNIAEEPICKICADSARNHRKICVVEEVLDVVALEKTGAFKGVYHVLHGALSPVDGIGPEQLKVQALMDRIQAVAGEDAVPGDSAGVLGGDVMGGDLMGSDLMGSDDKETVEDSRLEVIIATNPGLEGETTALYLLRLIKPYENVRVTRIARGLPVGGDLDYADEMTLTRALQGRAEYV